jgi:hypothetical protein
MTRLSRKIVIGLAVCLLNQGQGSAQDTRFLAPAIISDQILATDSMDGTDSEQQADNEVERAAWLQQPAMAVPTPTG